jgi:hypothetical protein
VTPIHLCFLAVARFESKLPFAPPNWTFIRKAKDDEPTLAPLFFSWHDKTCHFLPFSVVRAAEDFFRTRQNATFRDTRPSADIAR